MKKFKVRYEARVTFEGTIEADDVEKARKIWDEGFTPLDEHEVDRGMEELEELEGEE